MPKRKIFILAAILILSISSQAFALTATILGDTYACKTKEYMDKISELRTQGDKQAFDKVFIAGMMSGTCVEMKDGEAVFIEGGGIFSGGLYQIRSKGDTEDYWVQMEKVKLQ